LASDNPHFMRSRTAWRDRLDAGQLDATIFTPRTFWCERHLDAKMSY